MDPLSRNASNLPPAYRPGGTGELQGRVPHQPAAAPSAADLPADDTPAGRFLDVADAPDAPPADVLGAVDQDFNAQHHTVKPGECLWAIAERELGDGKRWREIYDLNRDLIKHPDLIHPGQVLRLPGAEPPHHHHHHQPHQKPPPPAGGDSPTYPLPPGVSQRDVEDFAQAADHLWIQGQGREGFQQDVANYADVNSSFHNQGAWKLIHKDASLVSKFRHQLTPEDRQRYDHLLAATHHDVQARLALETLLVTGKLTNSPKNVDGQDLLSALDQVATQPVEPPINRNQMLSDMIQEIAQPAAIAQHAYGTCTVTSVEVKTALENPAEYARIIGGLASPEGKVKLANGQVLHRYPGTQHPEAGDRRSISARLWQPAMMDFGRRLHDYRNSPGDLGGLDGYGVDRVLDAINGANAHLHLGNSEATLDAIRKATEHGASVPCGVQWGAGGHKILVTGIHGDRVSYINPWGILCSMSLDHFRRNLTSANITDLAHDLA
ncbi:MAG: hypothetical protein JWM80_2596 [Cyanobacteria bacterium RYN_339]|nr:hypothetical protein [Cyanobacteria bacterium RYN_339]